MEDYSQTVCMAAEVASGESHAQTTLVNGRDSAHAIYSEHLASRWKIKEFRGYEGKDRRVKRLAVTRSRTQDTSGLRRQGIPLIQLMIGHGLCTTTNHNNVLLTPHSEEASS